MNNNDDEDVFANENPDPSNHHDNCNNEFEIQELFCTPYDAPLTSSKPKDAPVTSSKPKDAPVTSSKPKDVPVTSAEPNIAPVTSSEPYDAPLTSSELPRPARKRRNPWSKAKSKKSKAKNTKPKVFGDYWEIDKVLAVRERVIDPAKDAEKKGGQKKKKGAGNGYLAPTTITEFLIQWKGSFENTWEPEDNLCDTALEDAHKLLEKEAARKLGLVDQPSHGKSPRLKSTNLQLDESNEDMDTENVEEVCDSDRNDNGAEALPITEVGVNDLIIEDTNFDWGSSSLKKMSVQRISVHDPNCKEQLDMSRLLGVPIVLTHHKGWVQFASRWLSLPTEHAHTITPAPNSELGTTTELVDASSEIKLPGESCVDPASKSERGTNALDDDDNVEKNPCNESSIDPSLSANSERDTATTLEDANFEKKSSDDSRVDPESNLELGIATALEDDNFEMKSYNGSHVDPASNSELGTSVLENVNVEQNPLAVNISSEDPSSNAEPGSATALVGANFEKKSFIDNCVDTTGNSTISSPLNEKAVLSHTVDDVANAANVDAICCDSNEVAPMQIPLASSKTQELSLCREGNAVEEDQPASKIEKVPACSTSDCDNDGVNSDTEPLDLTLPYFIDIDKMVSDIGSEMVPILRKNYNDEQPIKAYMSIRRFLRDYWPNSSSQNTEKQEVNSIADKKVPMLYLHQWLFTASETAVPKLCNQNYLLPQDILGEDLLRYWYNQDQCAGDSPYQYLFMGNAETMSRLHKDSGGLDIYIAPVVGQKEVTLVHRSDGPTSLYHLEANIEEPNFHKFPMLYSARVWQTIIHPGEILVMPQGTFHQCRNVTPCLSYHRFHLDSLNLHAFYESWQERDAPDIDHEEVIWNASTELCSKIDAYTDAFRNAQKVVSDCNAEIRNAKAPVDVAAAVCSLQCLHKVCLQISMRADLIIDTTGMSDWKLLVQDIEETLHEFRFRQSNVIPSQSKTHPRKTSVRRKNKQL